MFKDKYLLYLSLLILLLFIGQFFLLNQNLVTTWDSWVMILYSYLFSNFFFVWWFEETSSTVLNKIFFTPSLIPYSISTIQSVLGNDMTIVAHVISWIITTSSWILLYKLFTKVLPRKYAFFTILMIVFNRYIFLYWFDPERATFVVAFAIFSLYSLIRFFETQSTKYFCLSLFFVSILPLFHTTGYIWIILYWIVVIFCLFKHKFAIKAFKSPVLILTALLWFLLLSTPFKISDLLKSWGDLYTIQDRFDIDENLYDVDRITLFSEKNVFWKTINWVYKLYRQWAWQWAGYDDYLQWIESKFWDTLYMILLIFLPIAFTLSFWNKKTTTLHLLLACTALIYLIIASKRAAASHRWRYTYYILYMSMFLIVYVSHSVLYKRFYPKIFLLSLFLITTIWPTFLLSTDTSQRRLYYKNHYDMWSYIWKNIDINEKMRILYQWHPEMQFWVLDQQKWDIIENMIWYRYAKPVFYDLLTYDIIKKQNIKYFVRSNTDTSFRARKNMRDKVKMLFKDKLVELHAIWENNSKMTLYQVID